MTEENTSRVHAIGGFRVLNMRGDELIANLRRRREAGLPTELYFANSNLVQKCFAFAEKFRIPQALVVNDGIALDLASFILYGKPFSENLNGTDFTPRLLEQSREPMRVFLLGSKPDRLLGAAKRLSSMPNVEVVDAIDGFEGLMNDDDVVARLAASRPDVLLVALGNPLQEEWIVAHRGRHQVPLVIGVGALFDFLSGSVPRAPAILQRFRLEWLFRLIREPRRLARRYTLDIVLFIAHCIRTREGRR